MCCIKKQTYCNKHCEDARVRLFGSCWTYYVPEKGQKHECASHDMMPHMRGQHFFVKRLLREAGHIACCGAYQRGLPGCQKVRCPVVQLLYNPVSRPATQLVYDQLKCPATQLLYDQVTSPAVNCYMTNSDALPFNCYMTKSDALWLRQMQQQANSMQDLISRMSNTVGQLLLWQTVKSIFLVSHLPV